MLTFAEIYSDYLRPTAILDISYFQPFRHKDTILFGLYIVVVVIVVVIKELLGQSLAFGYYHFGRAVWTLHRRRRRQGTTGTIVYRLEFTFLETSSASILHWTFRLSQLSREFSGTGFARHLDYRVFI